MYVFGAEEGDWFKMISVNATGTAMESRHTNAISTIAEVTLAIWEAANTGGGYQVFNIVTGCGTATTGGGATGGGATGDAATGADGTDTAGGTNDKYTLMLIPYTL